MTTLHFSWSPWHLPRLRTAGYFFHAADTFRIAYDVPFHCIHQYDYETEFLLEGQIHHIAPGDITFTAANHPSSYRHATSGRHWCLHFFCAEERVLRDPLILPIVVRPQSSREAISQQFRRISELFNRPASDAGAAGRNTALASAIFLEMLHMLYGLADGDEAAAETSAPSIDPLERLLQYLEGHLGAEHSAETLARRAELSPNYLARKFRARFGLTIAEHIRNRRIEQAAYLLRTSDMPVFQIGSVVGIADPQYFNKTFRRCMGVSPAAYRAKCAPPAKPLAPPKRNP